ncbi:MAG: hypothetical protein IJV83_00025 [Clostridia bacterium]|nr:hypothetical protein [Clostridia bacterium]
MRAAGGHALLGKEKRQMAQEEHGPRSANGVSRGEMHVAQECAVDARVYLNECGCLW